MATIKEVKTELRHCEWAEQIQECQNSGQTVKEWCSKSGISPSTYYNRLRAVCEEMLSRQPKLHEIVPVSVSAELSSNNATMPERATYADKPKCTENFSHNPNQRIKILNRIALEIQKSVVPIRPDDGSTPRYENSRKV